MGVDPKHPDTGAVRSAAAFLLLCLPAVPALAGPAADWRYCYAGAERDRRFYVSQPFPAAAPMEIIERQWAVWLGGQALRYETIGCPRGADHAAIAASVRSAVRYNTGLGRRTVELNWQPAP